MLTSPPALQALTLDPANNLIQQVDFNQRTHTLSVDGDNRLQQQVDTCPTCGPYNAPITTTPAYDPDGNVLTLTAQTGGPAFPAISSIRSAYNALDWRTSQDDGWGPTSYGYDAAGRLRTEILPGGNEVISTTPDPAGRITSVVDTLTDTVTGATTTSTSSFTYTPDALPLTDTLPGGVTEGRSYDADNRLTQMQFTPPGPSRSAWTYGYAYSPQGATVVITNGLPGLVNPVWPLSYDAHGRLASLNTSTQTVWHYDPNGNLTRWGNVAAGAPTLPQATYAYTYAALGVVTPTGWLPNELVAMTTTHGDGTQQTTTYGYDQSGDTTAITAPNGLSYSLSYDALGRVAGVARLDPAQSTCCSVLIAYDALGRRVSYTAVAAGPTAPPPPFQELFQYRGSQVSQIVVTGTNTTPFTETFTYRPDGSPLELLYQRQDGQGHNQATARYWYVVDGQGSVVALTDSSGTVVNSYAYDLWGQQISVSASIPQPLRYHGYWWDGWDNMLSTQPDQGWNGGALPWYWLGAREYDPTLERFLQPDPSSQDGVRSYVYCHDAPADCTDPSGLDGEPDQGAGTDGAVVSGALDALTGQPSASPLGVQGAQLSLSGFDVGTNDAAPAADVADPAPQYATGSFTLHLSSGWRKPLRTLVNPTDQIIYQLADVDAESGTINRMLKPGRTSGLYKTILGRFKPYATAGGRLGLNLEIRAWIVDPPAGVTLEKTEGIFRQALLDAGETLPWDNSAPQRGGSPRLSRPGPGVPFVRDSVLADQGINWATNPSSPYYGMYLNSNGDPYGQVPDYYPNPLEQMLGAE